jgi:serine acetyltransferase/thymidylate kinase
MQHNSLLLLEFFRWLDARGLRHCVVGDSRPLPMRIASDVDVVVPQSAVRLLPPLIEEFCAHYRLRLVQCLQHEHNAYYFVLAFRDMTGKHAFLAIDLCGDYLRRGKKLLDADELLSTARPARGADGDSKGFCVSAPAQEFCYYLIKKIDKQHLEREQAQHLSEQWRLDPKGGRDMIERFWGRSTIEARLLTRAADSGDWTAVAKLLPRMRAALHHRIRVHPSAMFLELRRRWQRWRQPTGLLIAVLGPDGSGKSSVIAAVERRIREAFRSTFIVHLRPGFLYRPERVPDMSPHSSQPRGRVRSFLKLCFFAADYALGYAFFLRPRKVRSHGLLFDRYYDDLLVDPLRYRHRGSSRMAKVLRVLVPRPDLWLLLDAPAEVLQARKREVPWEESERQRQAYRELLSEQRHVAAIDAAQNFELVVESATEAILAHCEQRARKRLRLSRVEPRSPLGARWLVFCCRNHIPLLSKLTRLIFNSDIYCKVPRDIYLPHPYGIVIHSKSQLGRGVTVMQQVTLGAKDPERNAAPIVGDHAYLGAGARILGNVTIGTGAIVGANAVVTRDVPAGARVVGANRILADKSALTRAHSTALNLPMTSIGASTEDADDQALVYSPSDLDRATRL